MKKKAEEIEPGERIYNVPLDKILIGKQMVRHDPDSDDIVELAISIQTKGLLQPTGVRPNKDGTFQLLWGSRRMAAHLRLKKPTMPAVYRDTPDDEIKSIALLENIERKQLSLAEEVDAVVYLNTEEDLSPAAIAERLSRSRDWVLRRLRLPSMPPDIADFLWEGQLTLASAEEISTLDTQSKRVFLAQQVITTRATIREVRAMVASLKNVEEIEERIAPAVAVGAAQVANQTVRMDCAICGTPQEMPDLVMIQVCAKGCPEPPSTEEEISQDVNSTTTGTGAEHPVNTQPNGLSDTE